MQRKNILKQLSSIQKSIESLEKERKQGHFEPRKTRKPDRLIDEENPNPPIRTGKINPDTGAIDYDKSMEKARRRRWPTPTPPRLKDTKEDRERPKEVPKDRPAIPPYNPMEDIGKAEGDTTLATESTQRSANLARRRNEAAEDTRIAEIPPQPVVVKKPPYKMEYQDDDSPFDDETIPRTPYPKKDEYEDDDDGEDSSRRSSRDINYSMNKDSPKKKPEENFDMMRKAVEKSLLKLMQYGGA